MLGPTLLQVKLFGLTLILAIPQASFDPASTSPGFILALPLASKLILISCVRTSAGVTSLTVTIAVFEFGLPFTSITVKVTVLGPTLLQVKLFGLTLILAIPQASFDPASTSPGFILALPLASN